MIARLWWPYEFVVESMMAEKIVVAREVKVLQVVVEVA